MEPAVIQADGNDGVVVDSREGEALSKEIVMLNQLKLKRPAAM